MPNLHFKYDPVGFPMIKVETINAYVHLLPVTKIQFEYFLCTITDSDFDSSWYDEILGLNPRVSPNDIKHSNYWKTFLTAIRPSEAKRFANWYGTGYKIPSLDEWYQAYKYFKEMDPISIDDIDGFTNMRDRFKVLFKKLDIASLDAMNQMGYDRTLADQFLMRMGVVEWVQCSSSSRPWGGIGQPHPGFHGSLITPDTGQPVYPKNPEDDRLYYYGFRLILED